MVAISCARPGCPNRAVAWLTYDYGARQVWLHDRPEPAGDQWGLCQGHAGRLRVPKGWSELDRRGAESDTPAAPVRPGSNPATKLAG